jgi:hypothetical protein
MIRGILIAGWLFIFGSVVVLGLFPTLLCRIPHPEYIRIFLIPFVLVSVAYGIVQVYKLGMTRARHK